MAGHWLGKNFSEKCSQDFSFSTGEEKDFYGFLIDFSLKQTDSCQSSTRALGVKFPLQSQRRGCLFKNLSSHFDLYNKCHKIVYVSL